METKNMTKTISVALKMEELEVLEKLKERRIKVVEIFRRGLMEYEKDIKNNS